MTKGTATSEASLPVERRASRRFDLAWPTLIKGRSMTGHVYIDSCSLINVSSRGALLQVPRAVNIDDRVEISFKLPTRMETWIRYPGKVVRIDSSTNVRRVAIEFESRRPTFYRTDMARRKGASLATPHRALGL